VSPTRLRAPPPKFCGTLSDDKWHLFFFSTLLSIRDFMLRAAQTKWIGRFMAKSSIQDALLHYEEQLRDAAMSFQVRGPFLPPTLAESRKKLSIYEISSRR